jgi:hypothetical protein
LHALGDTKGDQSTGEATEAAEADRRAQAD